MQLQRIVGNRAVTQRLRAGGAQHRTGLPDSLKQGIEAISGVPMNDVTVHYNSPKPAGLHALAYTQGTHIHVAPGQEHSLPHEAWHVVQQKQGRVAQTAQLKGEAINDNAGLEREADGALGRLQSAGFSASLGPAQAPAGAPGSPSGVVQRLTNKDSHEEYRFVIDDHKITLLDAKRQERGFADFLVTRGEFSLKTINTKSGKGPKGSGAFLVYQLAMLARGMGFRKIMVTNATPEETGFYLHVGFTPDPDFLHELVQSGMPTEKVNQIKYTTLSANVNTLFDMAGASVVKNWSDPSWEQGGLYAGEHPEHGSLFHIPL